MNLTKEMLRIIILSENSFENIKLTSTDHLKLFKRTYKHCLNLRTSLLNICQTEIVVIIPYFLETQIQKQIKDKVNYFIEPADRGTATSIIAVSLFFDDSDVILYCSIHSKFFECQSVPTAIRSGILFAKLGDLVAFGTPHSQNISSISQSNLHQNFVRAGKKLESEDPFKSSDSSEDQLTADFEPFPCYQMLKVNDTQKFDSSLSSSASLTSLTSLTFSLLGVYLFSKTLLFSECYKYYPNLEYYCLKACWSGKKTNQTCYFGAEYSKIPKISFEFEFLKETSAGAILPISLNSQIQSS